MRADRLVAMLLLLQSRGRVTAAWLADELEVSVATARRDLEALAASGVPVYPQAGRGGGWSLVGGARTDLSGLTAPEARALFLLAGPAAAAEPAVRSALRKLVRALPATFRADAEAAADAVLVDRAPWGASSGGRERGVLDDLEQAVVGRRRTRITYARPGAEPTERLVDPWGLVDKAGVWYLVAGTERGRRTYRADRVVAVSVTEETATRPDDLDLAEEWDAVIGEVEQRRALATATVLARPRHAAVLADQFGRHAHRLGPADDGRVRVQLAAPEPLMIAQVLAGWGALLELERGAGDGAAVAAELARLGRELVAAHARDARRAGPAAPLRAGTGRSTT